MSLEDRAFGDLSPDDRERLARGEGIPQGGALQDQLDELIVAQLG